MSTAPTFAGVPKAVVRTALWFCASNLLVAVLAAQCSNPTQVPNQTISSGTATFSNSNALAASYVTINGSASITFVAGNCIDLQPGFHATAGTAGTTFHAWVEAAPAVVSVSPPSGSGLSQAFTWTVSDPSGYADLAQVQAIFNTIPSGQYACYVIYNRNSNLLYLVDNSGYWLGGFTPGSGGSASNPQCSIYGSGSSVNGSGPQLAVTVSVTFQPSFAGTKNNYLIAWDQAGISTELQQMGTWTVAGGQQYYLTTAVSPSGGGTIWPPSGWYTSGAQVPVAAAPAAGYTFAGFSGNLAGTALPQILVMNGNKSVTANFTATPPGQYSLTTSVSAAGAGTISPGAGSYNSGQQVTITATPASGYQFSAFTGSVNSGSNPVMVTMDSAKTVTANFAATSGPQSFSFPYTDANGTTRTWTITTQALAHVFTWDSSHWTYEPSVVLPSPQTNGKYVLIFSAGTTFGLQGIYVAIADSATGPFLPSPPTQVLAISGGLCDMMDAVPYWDDAAQIWHVYVQALKWVSGVCPTGTGEGGNGIPENAGIYEATGPSLTTLSWVLDPNNPGQALEVVGPHASGATGIGERIQWFNSINYLGAASVPFVVTFNDWSYVGQDCKPYNPNGAYVCEEYCPLCAWGADGGNGTPVFAYAGPDGTSPLYSWYYRQPASGDFNNYLTIYYPDVILGGSLDAATAGNPGFGFESQACGQGPGWAKDQPCSSYGVGFFPDPVPYANPNYLPYNGGFYFPGALSGTSATTMFRPRVARNVYGYIDPVPGSSPRTWQTYLYYTDCNWAAQGKGCGFGVSLLTITQQ